MLRSHATLEVTRRLRAFLKLDVGLTNNGTPDRGRELGQPQDLVRQKDRQLKRDREQLSNKNKSLETISRQLADRDLEIARLQELNTRQAAANDREVSGLRRQLHGTGRESANNGKAGHGVVSENLTADLYLDLMKRCLTDGIYGEDRGRTLPRSNPSIAHTLIGLERLDNLRFCVEDTLINEVPGDLIETGVWRGGATIFMRAILKAHGFEDRCVWVADSFEGFPAPDTKKYPQDEGDRSHEVNPNIIPSLDQVKDNFERYGLLDGQVRFLKGWFRDTLPGAPLDKLAVVRLDGDMYESTMDALVNLYPKLSVGGYLIVDDYGCFPACRQAVHDYRESHGIKEDIQSVDWTGVFWQRSR